MYASKKFLNERFTVKSVIPKIIKSSEKAIGKAAYNRISNLNIDDELIYAKIKLSDLLKYISEKIKNNNKDCSIIEDEEDKLYCDYFEIEKDIKIYKKFLPSCNKTDDPNKCKMKFKEKALNLEFKKQDILYKMKELKIEREKYQNAINTDKGVKYYNEIEPNYHAYINDSYSIIKNNITEIFNPKPKNKTGGYVKKLVRGDYKNKFITCKKMEFPKNDICRYELYQQLISDLKVHKMTCKTQKCMQVLDNAIYNNTQKASDILSKINGIKNTGNEGL